MSGLAEIPGAGLLAPGEEHGFHGFLRITRMRISSNQSVKSHLIREIRVLSQGRGLPRRYVDLNSAEDTETFFFLFFVLFVPLWPTLPVGGNTLTRRQRESPRHALLKLPGAIRR